ncbi:MAG: MBL fold metallo-hydrolase [Methanolobus sp.]|nr:MBL fold metallo-hydrolase [Methanolobus sp.]
MKLTVIYDNKAKDGLESGWGFACIVETSKNKVLFDTGWDGHVLLKNMEKLSIDPESIDTLVLSHQHWDHIGGVTTFLNRNQYADIYVPQTFSANLKKEMISRGKRGLHEINGPQNICKGIYTTGELGDSIKEQSLVVDSGKGLYIITGCAHPGLGPIIKAATAYGTVSGIFGGLHGSQEYGLFGNMHIIGAGHCTAHMKRIRELYPESFVEIFAGYIKEL